ncbi:MAG TPA: hypothetical protein VL977_08340, partial [Solirubrobacteraceae bacterium]|nr:hypothetical protein [Solirubrobacteraceae bacterium]
MSAAADQGEGPGRPRRRPWYDVMAPELTARQRLRRTPGRIAFRALNSAAHRMGYRLERDTYYSPLVDLDAVPREQTLGKLRGIAFDSAEQLRYVSDVLGPYLAELEIPDHDPDGGLHLRNGAYEAAEAETLYAIVRARKPARVL